MPDFKKSLGCIYHAPPGTIVWADVLRLRIAARHGAEWLRPFDVSQSEAGEIEVSGGPSDPELAMRMIARAGRDLSQALRLGRITAQYERRDGTRRDIAAGYWDMGAGLDTIATGRIDGLPVFIDAVSAKRWATEPRPDAAPAQSPAAGETSRKAKPKLEPLKQWLIGRYPNGRPTYKKIANDYAEDQHIRVSNRLVARAFGK